MLPLLLSSSGVAGIGVNSSCMTIELCGYIAQNQGFTYFGVEGGTREQQKGRQQSCHAMAVFSMQLDMPNPGTLSLHICSQCALLAMTAILPPARGSLPLALQPVPKIHRRCVVGGLRFVAVDGHSCMF